MSKEDYREKIEEHRQSINIEKPNSRQSRSRIVKNKKPKRRDPLMTILTVIFIFIPLVILVYVWGFYTPTTPGLAQVTEKEKDSVEVERNNNLSEEDTIIDEPVLVDDTVDEDEEQNDQSEDVTNGSKRDDQKNDETGTNQGTTSGSQNNGQVQENQNSQDNEEDNAGQDDEQQNNGKHQVKFGDTLYSIATSNGTTVERIMEVNGLQTPNIQEGQLLIIP